LLDVAEAVGGEFQELVAGAAEPHDVALALVRALRERGARGVPRGPRARTKANPAGLTARELEVLALLGEGPRNAEIAQRLVVSEKTAEHHTGAVLRKLGVCSRAEAAACAARLGFGPAADEAARSATPTRP
jgi:DNA-binding NarL/FixJ family response regulator